MMGRIQALAVVASVCLPGCFGSGANDIAVGASGSASLRDGLELPDDAWILYLYLLDSDALLPRDLCVFRGDGEEEPYRPIAELYSGSGPAGGSLPTEFSFDFLGSTAPKRSVRVGALLTTFPPDNGAAVPSQPPRIGDYVGYSQTLELPYEIESTPPQFHGYVVADVELEEITSSLCPGAPR